MYTQKQRDQYNKDRQSTCDRLGITENQYNSFRRLAQRIHELYEIDCNGFLTEEEGREEQDLTAIAMQKAEDLKLNIFFQTDPRGATIYLSKNPISQDRYNTQAECIY